MITQGRQDLVSSHLLGVASLISASCSEGPAAPSSCPIPPSPPPPRLQRELIFLGLMSFSLDLALNQSLRPRCICWLGTIPPKDGAGICSIKACGGGAGGVEEDEFSERKTRVRCPEGGEHIVGGPKPTQVVVYRQFAKALFFFAPDRVLRTPFVPLVTMAAPEAPHLSCATSSFCR